MPQSTVTHIALAVNEDGRLELVATTADPDAADADAEVWHTWQAAPSNGWLVDWSRLGPPPGGLHPTGNLKAAQNHDGRIEIAAVGRDGAIWHRWQTAPNNGWSEWSSLGHPGGPLIKSGSPVLAQNSDGRLELFAVVSDGWVWHRWQTAPNNGWSEWSSLGCPDDLAVLQGSLAVARNRDGRLELFAVAEGKVLWHRWQTRPSSGPWSDWSSLGQPNDQLGVGRPLVAQNQDGRLEVIAQAGDGAIWHRWQTRPSLGPWSAWTSLVLLEKGETQLLDLAVAANADGSLVVIFTSVASSASTLEFGFWQQRQTAPNNGWSSRLPINKNLPSGTQPTLALNADGRLELVFRDSRVMVLYRLRQDRPNGDWPEVEMVPPPPG